MKMRSILVLVALALLFGCGQGGGGDEKIKLVAEPGPNQIIKSRQLVTLVGSASPPSKDLSYTWVIEKKPIGSLAIILDCCASSTSFTADVEGDYLVSLVVGNKSATSEKAYLNVTYKNEPTALRPEIDAWNLLQSIIDNGKNGAEISLDPQYTYVLNSSLDLRGYKSVRINGNGAVIKRADSISTSTQLVSNLCAGCKELKVKKIPANFRIGEQIAIASGQSVENLGFNSASFIVGLDRTSNIITIQYPFDRAFDQGATVFKAFNLIQGLNSYEKDNSNPGTIIENIIFDGNSKNNSINYGWMINSTIVLAGGKTSKIRFNKFLNIPNENIVGHGFSVHNNTFDSLNGSAIHLSVNDETVILNGGSLFESNAIFNPNIIDPELSGHSEGAVTFSWGGGYLLARYNTFLGQSRLGGVFGYFGGRLFNMDKDLVVYKNLSNNFDSIITIINVPDNSTGNILITDNLFYRSDGFVTYNTNLSDSIRLGCNYNENGVLIKVPENNDRCV